MANDSNSGQDAADIFTELLRIQGEAARQMMQSVSPKAAESLPDENAVEAMGQAMMEFQKTWLQFCLPKEEQAAPLLTDPASWMDALRTWSAANPLLDADAQRKLWADGLTLWHDVLTQYSHQDAADDAQLPFKDRRFADPAWRQQPVFALIHQTYLLFAERIQQSVDSADGLFEEDRENLRFASKGVLDAMSPANYPLMNPVVLERTMETGGENLVRGLERLTHDLEKGQLTHTDTSKFKLGENIATTPGKVIYETNLFQIIQYNPTTPQVMKTPLLIFPPWINRFYILDLNAKKVSCAGRWIRELPS